MPHRCQNYKSRTYTFKAKWTCQKFILKSNQVWKKYKIIDIFNNGTYNAITVILQLYRKLWTNTFRIAMYQYLLQYFPQTSCVLNNKKWHGYILRKIKQFYNSLQFNYILAFYWISYFLSYIFSKFKISTNLIRK